MEHNVCSHRYLGQSPATACCAGSRRDPVRARPRPPGRARRSNGCNTLRRFELLGASSKWRAALGVGRDPAVVPSHRRQCGIAVGFVVLLLWPSVVLADGEKPDAIDVVAWIAGCSELTQSGVHAQTMDQTCTQVAQAYCAVGRSTGEQGPCYRALHNWLEAASDQIVLGLPQEQGQRALQKEMYPQLVDPEQCPFDPPYGVSKAVFCQAVFSGTQWVQWRDLQRRSREGR